MAESKTIQHPVVRMVTVAAAAFSITTILSGAVVGLTKPNEEAAHKWAFATSVIGTGCGALLGLVAQTQRQEAVASKREAEPEKIADQPWTGWRNFVVFRKVKESADITSFYLKPEDQAEIPNFQPGQFLTI
ncbi:MAG TPA: hypothetical protein V6C57_13890, partial [Coleofasciculaceae cyanobacterium]